MSVDIIELLSIMSGGLSKNFYSIMPLQNMCSVMQYGILSYDKAKSLKHESIALNEVQQLREKVCIPNGNRLHSYANLYFTHHNPMMYKRQNEAETICVLAISPSIMNVEGCVLSDRNAATTLAKFYTPEDGIRHIDFKLVFARDWTDDDPYESRRKKAIKCAEILVPDCVPYSYIVGAYVVSEKNAEALKLMGFNKKILVRPRVFYR